MKDDEDKRTTIAFHTPFLLNDNQPANNCADGKRKSCARKRNEAPRSSACEATTCKSSYRNRAREPRNSLPVKIARADFLLKYSKLYSSNKLVCRLFLQPLKY